MRRKLPIALLAAVLVQTASAAHAAPLGGVTAANLDAGVAAAVADLDQARRLHAKLVRLEVPWRSMEPAAAGRRDPAKVADLDAIVAAARSRHIKLVVQVDRTPCWTSTAPSAAVAACGDKASSYPPNDYEAYGRLAGFLAGRYRGALAAIEVWNEPDQSNEFYWAGPDKVKRYAALVRATYPLVKQADPALPVLVGAFVGTNGKFLSALYDEGIKGFYDGLSVHFYDLALYGLRTTRATQRAHGDSKPLWLLETGWNSCAPAKRGAEGQPCVTTATQAVDFTELFGQLRRTSYVKAVVIYKLRDDTVDRFGVLTSRGYRKPSFAALGRVFAGGRRPVRTPTLRLRVGVAGVIASGSGPDGDFYRLRVRRGGRLVFIADLRVTPATTFRVVIPRAAGTSALAVELQRMWDGTTVRART